MFAAWQETEDNLRAATMLDPTIILHSGLTAVPNYSKMYGHVRTYFQDPNLNGSSVGRFNQVRAAAMLLDLLSSSKERANVYKLSVWNELRTAN